MIKMLTAFTREADEAEVAVSEILAQLDLEHKLLAHSVGIMNYYFDFFETGVAGAISDALPHKRNSGSRIFRVDRARRR
jgi:hypothetical protein